jgi:phage-related holin
MVWTNIVAFFGWLWSQWQVQVLLGHILVNVVVAVAASIVLKEFLWSKIGDFLYRKVLPFLMVYVVASGVGDAAGMAWLATVVWGVLEVNLAGDLADNLGRLGITLPGSLRKPDLKLIETEPGIKLEGAKVVLDAGEQLDAPEVASVEDELRAAATEASGLGPLEP